jgi:hypothetical protein
MSETSFVNIDGVIVPGSFIPADIDHTMQEAWTFDGQAFGIDLAKRAALMKARFQAAIEAHVNVTAHARGYHSDVSLASHVASTIPAWAAEATAFIAWRDAVWLHVFAQLALVESGDREEPTIDGLIAELPAISWPT